MILPFVLVIWVLWVSISLALYSSFMPYFWLLGDIEKYNKAYYGAHTAIERSLLALRYHEAWFEGRSGREGEENIGTQSDYLPVEWFFGDYDAFSHLLWSIDSRVTWSSFPAQGGGQIPSEFLTEGSTNDFWVLSYGQLLKIPLRVDASPINQAYTIGSNSLHYYYGAWPKFRFVLNEKIHNTFGQNLEENAFDEQWFPNEIAINRTRNGKYWSSWLDYSILPRSFVWFLNAEPIILSHDESLRMGDINKMTSLLHSAPSSYVHFDSFINPLHYSSLANSLRSNSLTWHLMIGWGEDELIEVSFADLLTDASQAYKHELEFSLQNMLRAKTNKGIYPFVQWRLQTAAVWWATTNISKPYFDIVWSSQVWGYDVSLQLQQPLDGSYLWSFTVVF